jgi:hypothetical protein
MARFFIATGTRKIGEVELRTLEERVLCDNPICPQHVMMEGVGNRDEYLRNVVIRDDKEYCAEACYLTTPDGKARMELMIEGYSRLSDE